MLSILVGSGLGAYLIGKQIYDTVKGANQLKAYKENQDNVLKVSYSGLRLLIGTIMLCVTLGIGYYYRSDETSLAVAIVGISVSIAFIINSQQVSVLYYNDTTWFYVNEKRKIRSIRKIGFTINPIISEVYMMNNEVIKMPKKLGKFLKEKSEK